MNSQQSTSDYSPSFAELLDFAEGKLDPSTCERLEAHLAEAPEEATKTLKWIRTFLEASGETTLYAMPKGLEERLVDVYDAASAPTLAEVALGLSGAVRRIIAKVVESDSDSSFAALALRSRTLEAFPQQWTFKAEEMTLVLDVLERSDACYDVHGQVYDTETGEWSGRGSVQLMQNDCPHVVVEVDEFGEFIIEGVERGSFELILNADALEIVCKPLMIGAKQT